MLNVLHDGASVAVSGGVECYLRPLPVSPRQGIQTGVFVCMCKRERERKPKRDSSHVVLLSRAV